ncbi:MAG TPA: HAMP domain-containing sensor histidine kinase, partial [Solirubrobacterales bacterium]|nr:HAMP domain-containing sensor histidine kinase [Solirubrobacterales bacterium]
NCLQMSQSYVAEYRNSIRDPEVTVEDHEAIATDLQASIDLAVHSARKVAQFVRTIKNQTRMGDEVQRGVFDPADEVHGVVSLLQHELRNRHVELHVEVEPGRRLMGDPGKFGLVLQNLVTNAIDAYEKRAGEVWVRLYGAERGLVLEVEDHGCGIPEEIRGKIYDYLFTTKDIGQGTGLGLALVHSTVTTQFSGEIEFSSELGVGTTFRVIFPVLPERA